MLKYLAILLLLFAFSNKNISQTTDNSSDVKDLPLKERFFTGGNFGLLFGTITYIDFSPILGYRLTNNFVAGIGATYIYYNDATYSPRFITDIYGGKVFARYYILQNIFAHGELEALNFEGYSQFNNGQYIKERIWTNSILLGGGYRQMISNFSSLNIMVLWNFSLDINTPQNNPVLKIGFDIGL